MGKTYKLSSDIFNIAVWANTRGAKRMGWFKRLVFTLMSGIVVVAQVQISYTIIDTFLKDMRSEKPSKAKAPWDA